jgi:DnaJ homolog subfamily C member 17
VIRTGDRFDPEKWQLLERGRDVLMDRAAKDAYDSARSAALVREEQRKAMDARKRAMVEDLEARERGEIPKRMRSDDGMSQAELQKLHQAGNRRVEERRRAMAEAEVRERLAGQGSNLQQDKPPVTTETQHQPEPKPTPQHPSPPPKRDAPGDEEDDPDIVELQRKIREAKEKKAAKAARKADKAARAGGKLRDPESREAQETPTQNPIVSGTKADEKKVFSFSGPSSSATASAASSKLKGDWSSTMARLKAAQAEKERRKADESAGQAEAS